MSDHEFFIHASNTEKQLYVSRAVRTVNAPLSPCDMTPGDVDFEMAQGKHPEILRICGMDQQSLEHFVLHYGKSYRYLDFFKCQLIRDFSPLGDLPKLERVDIYWNIRSDRLWDMSGNTALRSIHIMDAKRMTFCPDLVKTAPALEEVSFHGSPFNNTPIESLACFSHMPALKYLDLRRIRLHDKNTDVLQTLPTLEQFDFDAGMFTTEEIAWLVAKYPHLSGICLGAYTTEDTMLTDVRICGFRKPGLDLPEGQKRLDKYIAQFNALVEQYRNAP